MSTSPISTTNTSDDQKFEPIRVRLEQEHAELTASLRECMTLLESESAPGGTEANFREEHEAVAKQYRESLAAIEQALERLHAGTYGQCTSCGSAIPVERLEWIPYATTCVACQSNASSTRRR